MIPRPKIGKTNLNIHSNKGQRFFQEVKQVKCFTEILTELDKARGMDYLHFGFLHTNIFVPSGSPL